jgi:2-phospho-L-lactate guanylyltransferase
MYGIYGDLAMTTAIVPFKTLSEAKSRLASVLSPADRRALALAMLDYVLTALAQSHTIDHIIVTASDGAAQALVTSRNITLISDIGTNLNHSLQLAIAQVPPATSILIIHADLPLVEADDIDEFVNSMPSGGIALAGSHDGGTTALACDAVTRMHWSFGAGSLQRHMAAAKAANLPVISIREGPITFDIDRPIDLFRLRNDPGGRQTGRLLSRLALRPEHTEEE